MKQILNIMIIILCTLSLQMLNHTEVCTHINYILQFEHEIPVCLSISMTNSK